METQTCPKCGFPREPQALDCPVCGIVYAKVERRAASSRPAPASPGPASATAPPPLPPANPYAAPRANLSFSGPPLVPQQQASTFQGLWRAGDELVLLKGYPLPGRCLACNRDTSYRWKKTFSWVPSWVQLTVLLSIPIYLVVYYSMRKQADLAILLCQEHEAKRKKNTMLSWVLVLGGLVMMPGCLAASDTPRLLLPIFFLGLASFLAGAILSVNGNIVRLAKMDDNYVWLKKVSPEFLATVPQMPA